MFLGRLLLSKNKDLLPSLQLSCHLGDVLGMGRLGFVRLLLQLA